MAFPSDGRNHRKAILSESTLIKYKHQIEAKYGKSVKEIKQIGGTRSKIDIIIIFDDSSSINLSLKSKKSVKTGSFDYVNTSIDWPSSGFPKTYEIYNYYRRTEDKNAYPKLKLAISDELVRMDPDLLTNLFIENVIKKYDDISLTIIDEENDLVYFDVLPKSFSIVKDGGRLSIRKSDRNNMSYIVDCIDKNGDLIEVGLRIRVHLNNGSTKWLNKGDSILVIKFQQDKVYSIVK